MQVIISLRMANKPGSNRKPFRKGIFMELVSTLNPSGFNQSRGRDRKVTKNLKSRESLIPLEN